MLKKISLIFSLFISIISAQQGLVKSYFPDGKIESEIFYVNKIREGVSKFYLENGNLRREFSYINGKVDGLLKEYYENGKLKLTYNIENGKKEGRISLFKGDGTYLTDIPYERGKRVIENISPIEEAPDSNIKKTGNPREENSEYVPDRKSTRLNSSHANISYAVF